MQPVNTQVLVQADLDTNPLLVTLGAMVGDTLAITRPDPAPAPVAVIGDVCTMPDGVTAGTMQDDGTGTGTLVCVATVAPAPVDPAPVDTPAPVELGTDAKEGDVCMLEDGVTEGVYQSQGSKATGTVMLVCVPKTA